VKRALRFAPRSAGGITLRVFEPGDVEPYVASFAEDAEQGRLLGVERDPTVAGVLEDLPKVEEEAADGRFLWLAIAGDALLGCIWVHHVEWRHARLELGVLVVPGARGRGVAAQAVDLVCRWAFDELGFERVEMTTTPDNAAVRSLASRAGFAEEGIMRSRDVERGQRVDIVMLARLRET